MNGVTARASGGARGEPRYTAFAALYAEHHTRLRRLARMLCGDPDLAEDLVQETWLRAWRAVDRLADPAASWSWLVTILKREQARLYERRRPDCVALADHHPEPAHHPRPDLVVALGQALARLAADERAALRLQLVDGLPTAAIALHWGVSRNAMILRLHRIKAKLRQM